MPHLFDHEKLNVYNHCIDFIAWLNPVFDAIPKNLSVRDQIDRASTSIPLNIAEGNGKFTERDRRRFFDTARGSALECAACLDVLEAKGALDAVLVREGKQRLHAVVSMLVGLIKSNSAWRAHEDGAEYVVGDQALP